MSDPTPANAPTPNDDVRRPPAVASAALADALWAASPDCVKRLDLDGNVLAVNDAGRRLLGLDDGGPPPPTCWFGWWDDLERAKVERAVAEARAGRPAAFDAWAVGRDGGVRCWAVRVVPVLGREGRPAELIASSRDVTGERARGALAAVHAPANDPPREPADVAARPHVKEYAIFSLGLDGVVNGWGEGARALFGWTADEIIGRAGDPLWTAEDLAAGVPGREMAAAARAGVARDRRWHLRADGTRVFVDGAMLARVDARGIPAGFVKIGRDDTGRRAVEEELGEVRQRLDSALIAAEIGTYEWTFGGEGDDGIRGDANFQRLFGIPIASDERLPLRAFLDAIHPEDRPAVEQRIEAALERDERYETEYRIVRRDDASERWVIARGAVERDPATNRPRRFAGVLLDVTDRKRAEAERQAIADERTRQARVYDTILSATEDFAYIFDPDKRLVYANRRLLEVWGVTLDRAVGRTLDQLGYPAWHVEMHHREIDEVIRTRRPIRGEVPFVGGSGQGGVYDYIFSPVIGPDGRVELVAGTTRDVTARRAAEDARRAAEQRDRFLAELGEATRDLTDPTAVVDAVLRRLREHLGASRAAYADVAGDGDAFVIHPDRCDVGMASSAGTYSLDAFGPRAASLMRGGRTLIVRDVDRELADGDADPAGAATFHAIDVRAIVCCPLIRGGRLVAMMAVHQRTPRDWTAADVALVETTVERTWSYVERARGMRELAESEARFRALADAMPQIVWTARPDGHVEYYNRRWYDYTGIAALTDGDASWVPVLPPEDERRVRDAWARSLASGEPYEVECRLRRADGAHRWHLGRALPVRDDAGRIVRWYGTNTDIHDQKMAEARFRQLADAMPQIVWAASADGTVDYYNRRWFDYTGLPDDGRIGDDSWLSAVPAEDVARTAPMWQESLRLGRRLEFECRYRRHDGQHRWHLCRAEPVRDESGTVVRWYATNTDIHDQKMIEAALAEGQARFRQLADAMPQIVFAADPEGRVDYFNSRWYEYTGIDPLTPTEQWQQVHTPEGLARVMEAWPRALASGEPYEIEYPLRRADGAFRWHLGRALPVRDDAGRIVRWFGTNTDIHDQKLTEAALAAEKVALERIAAGAPIGEVLAVIARGVEAQGGDDGAVCSILVADHENRTLRNGATPSLPKSFAVDVEGAPIAPLTGACGTAAYRGKTVHVADTRTDENWAEFQGHAAKYRLAAATSMPIPRADGTVAGTVCIYYRHPQPGTPSERDLELLRTAAHLAGIAIERDRAEQALRAALGDATRARAAAEHASRMKDEFLATLSHELRTPLSAILGWSQLLRRPNIRPESLAQGLDTIERNARAQTQIIEDLLDMSRIISGKVALDPRRCDLGDVLAAAVETVRPVALGKNIEVTLEAGPAPIVGDPNRLQQVFWNLLTNAVKFTPRGGHVRVTLDRDASQWRARVRDDGEGIAPDFLPFVFDRFRQADASITRRHGGLGLGLAIVKQIVELHGGHAEVASEGPGRGATFTVRLPIPATAEATGDSGADPEATRVASAAAAAAAAADPTIVGRPDAPPVAPAWDPVAARRLAGVRVLVVDDEPDARGLLRHLLESCSATVVEAGDAEAAIAQLRAATPRPDVIVSDIGMPGENGYSMLARAREIDAAVAQIPAIALTAYARAEDRVAALRAGFQMHVPKPVEPAELIATIASLLGRRESLH